MSTFSFFCLRMKEKQAEIQKKLIEELSDLAQLKYNNY